MKGIIKVHTRARYVRALLVCCALCVSIRMFGVGWTPTDGGLVVDLQQGERFLLSVWLDLNDNKTEDPGEEFFVTNYSRYTGGYFNYKAGQYIRLVPQASDATEPSDMSIWSVGAPLTRVDTKNAAKLGAGNNYALGAKDGTVYTIWNDGKTLKTQSNHYKFMGDQTDDLNDVDACDVVFVIPTDNAAITSFDPNKTLRSVYKRTDQNESTGKINGKMGKGFLGMTYREVYMLEIPRFNPEVSYTNAALVTFNTELSQKSWSNGDIKCDPGHAAYAYADDKHKPTPRMLFRLYTLDDPINYCNSYFFATDEQYFMKYRRGPGGKQNLKWQDTTALKRIYTWDHFAPMTAVNKASTSLYKTGYMTVPAQDSSYYYVGWNNDWRDGSAASEPLGSSTAKSAFMNIRELPLTTMPEFKAPVNAYGRMVVDTSETADNLGVKFEPKGYMLKVSTGKNVRMRLLENSSTSWRTEEMWTITETWAALKIKATLMTGSEFSETDPGADVIGWTDSIVGTAVPVQGSEETVVNKSGWAVIDINNTAPNGNLRFILANKEKRVYYDNNGFLGTQIPDQYPPANIKKVTIEASRLKAEYEFDGWTTEKDGKGVTFQPGDVVDFDNLPEGVTLEREDSVLHLYAQAHYNGTLQVALSFINPTDSKRYFITHPNNSAPRYARARHFDHWENTWQGMENAENEDPNYLSTFEMRWPVTEIKKKDGEIPDLSSREMVLDPRRYTMKGYVDSLTFYEYFAPAKDEYLGLYYADPLNTILANNTWAGLFTTTSEATSTGWPTYLMPYIESTKLKSERYVEEYDPVGKPDSLILKVRGNNASGTYVKYNSTEDKFDGATEGEATDFQLTAISVADAHYIVLPDTSEVWRDTIEFAYHKDEQTKEAVWSKLWGKQLLAVMMVDGDTIFFHPNRNKIINDPNQLYLSSDFRVSQAFELIPDARVTSVAAEDRPSREETSHYWHNDIVSGNSSPIDVKYKGEYIDIVDTFRITLSHGGISKIKEYRGRWKKGAPGLTVSADGSSRTRNVIIRTKTYHYGDTIDKLVLVPEHERYTFNPLADNSQRLNFQLLKVRSRVLYDIHNDSIREDWLKTDTITSSLDLGPGSCSFSSGGTEIFNIVDAVSDHVTIATTAQNKEGENYDTLIVSKSITIGDITYNPTVRVPLVQTPLEGDELVWSFVRDSKRYFIVAGTGGIIFREFTEKNSVLYKNGTTTHLKKGSANAANDDDQYITPWAFGYHESDATQIWLQTKYGVNKYIGVSADKPALVEDKALWTFRYATEVYVNDNGNEEELVRLKYGASNWLAFDGTKLTWAADSASATVFTWSYLKPERYLLNNGAYPSRETATFEYNEASSATIQTRYKAYKDSSMLLDNKIVYLCREDEIDIANLVDAEKEWKTDTVINLIRDARTFDGGAKSSGLSRTTNATTLTTTITSSATSPTNITIGGKYVDIVDTLDFQISRGDGAPSYKFKGDWSEYSSIEDTHVKVPLVRKTYHSEDYSTLSCTVENEETRFSFPSTIKTDINDEHEYVLHTILREGRRMLDVDDNVVAVISEKHTDITEDRTDTTGMHLTNKALAEIRLMDLYGNKPDWCVISDTTDNSITVKCLSNGIRSPRAAYLYVAYMVTINGNARFVNYRLTVSQASYFEYANNQHLNHTPGASGDPVMADGRQQVHENKRILYYYPDQDTELPVRERAFYGWWRWYREGEDEKGVDVSEADVPDSLWRVAPINDGKYDYPFRIIGDSVDDGKGGKKLVTMGRWTIFHYKSKDYGNKQDPPSKNPRVAPPDTMHTGVNRGKPAILTYVVDLSNYYDNLPMSLKDKNQIDAALMDTMLEITEPTLSLREVFELHPWTEMADTLDNYRSAIPAGEGALADKTYPLAGEKYMEDHVMMAPTGAPLLLQTEQRYINEHLQPKYDKDGKVVVPGHSESLLGYYMHDDNWGSMSATKDEFGWSRQDSMIWCGGWDADCVWYTYNPKTQKYTECTHPISEEEDFLKVPAKSGVDTVYYCLRARSKKTGTEAYSYNDDTTEPGDYWFNICRYKIIYHDPKQYGPIQESNGKALITNDEIEQNYEVLERLNFDYIKPGSDYHVYPHPLPWADASYGYTYPETPDLPHNRYHEQSDFPNHGEYGIVNRIPYSEYWHKMEQHGGAENGYMIYCDGMSSAGQVAALTLQTELCEGQKMYFSGYVGNPSTQSGKSNPNFIFSVQGSTDGNRWMDITSYMTGDILPSNKWSQIFFPIHQEGSYEHFRVRIYNVASSFDGNDFIIDDMCIFATKSPLIAYQANTKCVESGDNDSITQVVLRVDYQGINNEAYNNHNVYYTVEKDTIISGAAAHSYVPMIDHYMNESIVSGTPDTVFGYIPLPSVDYEPTSTDSIFSNLDKLVAKFEDTNRAFKKGYIYENLDGDIRPVLYVVHEAKMAPNNNYTVRMALSYRSLLGSMCAMTSSLKVSNRMMLEINGEESAQREVVGMCANSTYDLSIRVKGSLNVDSVAPIDLNGSCINDWLLYGDTAKESSKKRYGYYYSDIVKVVKNILRREPVSGTNPNQFAKNLSEVNKNEMVKDTAGLNLITKDHPYNVLDSLVSKGFLTMYKSKITATITTGDSLQYVVFPIVGTGSDAMHNANVEVCPMPLLIKLKPSAGGSIPLSIGGLNRDSTQNAEPLGIVASTQTANDQIAIRIDSIASKDVSTGVAIHSIVLRSTDDPNFLEGVHSLNLLPDKEWKLDSENPDYYANGDTMLLRPESSKTYQMRPGYKYIFDINLMKRSTGSLYTTDGDPTSCRIGRVPFTLSVVPDYLRWNPKSAGSNQWNNPDNWLGVDNQNKPIHEEAHFAPLATTNVIIPKMEDGLPYPELPNLDAPSTYDSVKQVGFEYNKCDVIRFLPGAAMSQQQRMNYGTAIVDMSLPHNKWALRSAPVTGVLSGDIFMSNADLNGNTSPWEVGEMDANGRTNTTGNAAYWLSMYSSSSVHVGNNDDVKNDTVAAAAEWARVTNALTLSLPPAKGWAVYARTSSEKAAAVRLPKNDDIYYYYNRSGDKMDDLYEHNLRSKRETEANAFKTGSHAGELAFQPTGASQAYRLENGAASTTFVFGNPTMGYIDIWGFLSDHRATLVQEIHYIDESGHYTNLAVTKSTADETTDTITEQHRYLPPMHAIVLTAKVEATTLDLTLDTSRVVTHPSQKKPLTPEPSPAPRRSTKGNVKARGIMTVTAINPVSSRCSSRLLLGQGYHNALREGEDAILTTINIDHYSTTSAPATPFNIYASDGGYGLSIDLLDSIVNVPIAFYLSADMMEYFSPTTQLWFTGVNAIDDQLVLYDAWTDTERAIIDGICLTIETPDTSHQKRYYIRRKGYKPDSGSDPITTDVELFDTDGEQAVKVIHNGQVIIIRHGHAYSVFGQKIR